jgi:hypothetical protein|tara:strand:- start:683 stop:904 length:222 start_codon:yes stop_codon:yes gene_type:complete
MREPGGGLLLEPKYSRVPQQLIELGGSVERIWLTSRHRTIGGGCWVKDLNIDQNKISRAIQIGDDEIWLFEEE